MNFPAHEIVKSFKAANWHAQYKTPFGVLDTDKLADETVLIEARLLELQKALELAIKYVPEEIKTNRGIFYRLAPNPDYHLIKRSLTTQNKRIK